MKKKLIIFLLIACVKSIAAEPINDSSAVNRKAKTYTMAAQIVGYGPAASELKGVHLGYFVDPNTQLQLEITGGTNPLIWGSSGHSITSYVVGTHVKLFTGNSFYLKLGIDYRRIDYRYEDPVLGSNYEKTSFLGNTLGAAFLIGNQWQWQNFTFGADWIGLSGPLVWQIESSGSVGTNPNIRRRDKDEDRYLKENVIILSRLFVGASF